MSHLRGCCIIRSTRLADLFYRLDINPFYVVAVLVVVVPVFGVVFFTGVLNYELFYSMVFTLLVFLFCCLVFYLYFHRSPQRLVIRDEHAVLSPADGRVVYIREIEKGTIIESVKKTNHMKLTELLDVPDTEGSDGGLSLASGYIVGIELRLFDVHLTRAPISGAKVLDHHVSGRIVSMNTPGFECINDRETVVIRKDSFQVAVVQIATFLTRTVKSFVRNKDSIVQGEPLGMIRLGSQVDLVLYSKNVRMLVKQRDRVYAGITKIAEIAAA